MLGRCPLAALHRLGGWGGLAVYWLSEPMRQRMIENMARCLGRVPTRAELHTNARETGRMMLELPFVWQRPLEQIARHVIRVEGWELLEKMRAEGKTMVALTPHMGCFEITSLYVGADLPVTILYRPPKQKSIEPILRAGRMRGKLSLATADLAGVRNIIRGLRQGIGTGLLPDQAPGKGEGIWVPFFGKPAYTMTLAARLSEVKNTQVLLFWGERVAGQGWILHLYTPEVPVEGSLEERVRILSGEVERLIRRCPAQYLWAYNRYKVPAGANPPPSNPAP